MVIDIDTPMVTSLISTKEGLGCLVGEGKITGIIMEVKSTFHRGMKSMTLTTLIMTVAKISLVIKTAKELGKL